MESIEARLFEEVLPFVNKPGRYVGNELNAIKKNWTETAVRIGLVFPELYELGMSYQGFQILYHILNHEADICAERIFSPDEDLESLLRKQKLPLFSLETKHPLAAFDMLGFTFQYELHITNLINILDLGQIPLLAEERDETAPLIVVGGPCAFNPEPIADFVDAVVLGDGEEISLEIAAIIRQAKTMGWTRKEKLHQLAKIQGIYIPQFYQVEYDSENKIKSIQRESDDLPEQITARILPALDPKNYSPNPIVPFLQITHDRLSMEIMRGCSRGCRFCNAGMIYRPVRERDVADLIAHAKTVLKNTGYEEISLVSLSSSDYSDLRELMQNLNKFTAEKQVKLSFPSLRPETFTSEIAQLAADVKKSGLTLAPEAGTERLRKVINKTNSNEDLLKAVQVALENGWQLIKLYFMIGLPTETDEDLQGIVELLNQVVQLTRKFGGKKINVSLSPFVPKPDTPFQWERQNSIDELSRKIDFVRKQNHSRNVSISWRDPEVALLEGVLARGDRRVGAAILNAWRAGAKFDAWTHRFSFQIWQKAFEDARIDPEAYLRERAQDEIFPWEHLSKGISKKFLLRERENGYLETTTEDCRLTQCHACGLMLHPVCQEIGKAPKAATADAEQPSAKPQRWGRRLRTKTSPAPELTSWFRVKYSRGPGLRFFSHLDMIRFFERTCRRADIPLVFSQGYNPHPKFAFGPPLSLGFISHAEYWDIQCLQIPLSELFERLKMAVAGLDMEIIQTRELFGKVKSLTSLINRVDYQVMLPSNFYTEKIDEGLNNFHQNSTFMISREKKDKIQQFDAVPFIRQLEWNEKPYSVNIFTHLDNGKTVRVDEVLNQILNFTPEEAMQSLKTRLEMYIEYGDLRMTPMEI